MVEGESCVIADLVAFDVDDRYAFDIDETVSVTLTYATNYTAPFVVGWDKSGGSAQGLVEVDVKPDLAAKFSSVTLKLDRARFAGQGVQGSDLAIGIQRQKNGVAEGLVTLCDIKVERSNTTPAPAPFGNREADGQGCEDGRLRARRESACTTATGRAPLALGQGAHAAALRGRPAHAARQRAHLLAVGEPAVVLRGQRLRGRGAGRHLRARRLRAVSSIACTRASSR